MGERNTESDETAGGLRLTIDGTAISLLARVGAMIKLIAAHQYEIEQHASGQVTLDYAPWQVALTHRRKLGLQKIQKQNEEERGG